MFDGHGLIGELIKKTYAVSTRWTDRMCGVMETQRPGKFLQKGWGGDSAEIFQKR